MTFLEAYTIVTKELETTPYNRNAMVEAFMKGYAMAMNNSYEWLKARNVLTDASLEGFRNAMTEDLLTINKIPNMYGHNITDR